MTIVDDNTPSKAKVFKCGGRNLHLFRATVITSDNGVNSGSGWSLPSQYCTQTARASGAATVHGELPLRVFGNASRTKLTRIMCMDSGRTAQ